MSRAACLATTVVALAGCATLDLPPPSAGPGADPSWTVTLPAEPSGDSDLPDGDADAPGPPRVEAAGEPDLPARLAARARSFLGRRGPFQVGGERFNGDCSGFVQAVYAAEGVSLRGLMQQAAPRERGAVKAAWASARESGVLFGAGESPRSGDLVFWSDTYDRNRNRRADDPLTHVGIVEYVDGGTVTFLHRGGKGVARGAMTLGRAGEARDGDGRLLNSTLRARSHPVKDGGLAAELFAGYGRIEPGRARSPLAGERPDPPPPPTGGGPAPRERDAAVAAAEPAGPPPAERDEPAPATPMIPMPAPPSGPAPDRTSAPARSSPAAETSRAGPRSPASSAKPSRTTRKAAERHAGVRSKKATAAAHHAHRRKGVANGGTARPKARLANGREHRVPTKRR